MRRNFWRVATGVGLALGLIWLIVFWTDSHPPITARVVDLEPLQMVDDANRMLSLLVLSITNRAAEYFELPRQAEKIEGKVAGQWVELRRIDTLGGLAPNRSFEFLILVPHGTDRCRLRLQYQPARAWWRFWVWVKQKHPRFATWAWGQNSPVRPVLTRFQGKNEQFPRPERWWHVTLERALPGT